MSASGVGVTSLGRTNQRTGLASSVGTLGFAWHPGRVAGDGSLEAWAGFVFYQDQYLFWPLRNACQHRGCFLLYHSSAHM